MYFHSFLFVLKLWGVFWKFVIYNIPFICLVFLLLKPHYNCPGLSYVRSPELLFPTSSSYPLVSRKWPCPNFTLRCSADCTLALLRRTFQVKLWYCFFFKKKKSLFIYLAALGLSFGMLGLTCGTWDIVLWPEMNLGPLHWEHRILATGPPEKSHAVIFLTSLLYCLISSLSFNPQSIFS